jgi:predicted nucleic acid-binding protein
MKIILDTNVIIAAFATRGLCSAVFELCLDRFEVVYLSAKENRPTRLSEI